ncbi:MAG: hypothetical protein WCW56_01585 [Candidatus Paceibacterota bacterium]
MSRFKKILTALVKALVIVFALIGFILTAGFLAQYFGWTKVPGAIDWRSRYYSPEVTSKQISSAWQKSEEWATLKKALAKDAPVIQKAATDAGLSPRLIATTIISEQIRLFTSEREVFKQVFAPLSILGVQSQFSLGVTGIKYETAKQVETNLQDSASPFYLGADYEHLLDFSSTTVNADNERLARLTDEHDHYYSYLYTGLYLREVIAQWQKAGVDISHQPGVLATLFNLGFVKSKPNPNPAIGGAEIEVGGQKYTFGGLAEEFYNSDELLAELPR